jgi:flagellar biosynthesis/type III secretory pathway chaperone
MNDLVKLKDMLGSFSNLYDSLLALAEQEREYLVNIDIKNLMKVVELKQYIGLKLKKLEDELKGVLDKYKAENVSEFLFIVSQDAYVDDIRVLNGMLREKISEYNKQSEINRMITEESVSFYGGLMNIYAELFKNVNESYDKDASVSINQQTVSVRV